MHESYLHQSRVLNCLAVPGEGGGILITVREGMVALTTKKTLE